MKFCSNDDIVISGSGVYHPKEIITNQELADTYNTYVDIHYSDDDPNRPRLLSAKYIETISGIQQRYVRDKKNILNPHVMWPHIPERPDHEVSMQAEACIEAAKVALNKSNNTVKDIDAVIVSCSHKQRDFPSIAIEVQHELGIQGYAYDMNSACSSATFGIHAAFTQIKAGSASKVLLICPEIKSGQFSYHDPSSNFIFGEATGALIIEKYSHCQSSHAFSIKDILLYTCYSNNIRNNRGAYNNCAPKFRDQRDKLFYQKGRQVFKDIARLAPKKIIQQLNKNHIDKNEIKRFWFHQANSKLNYLVIKNILGDKACHSLAPIILNKYGNVSSAGVIVCFDKYQNNLSQNDFCILSTFGAGYAMGSILLQYIEQ